MAKTLDQLVSEADMIIEKRASQKVASSTPEPSFDLSDDDIFKLASDLRAPRAPEVVEVEKAASEDAPSVSEDDFTLTEKLAHSIALVDTLVNLPLIQKLAAFEEKALAAGHSAEKVAEAIKRAAEGKWKSVAKLVGTGIGAGAAGFGAGHLHGKGSGFTKGRDEGRREGAMVGYMAGRSAGQNGNAASPNTDNQ